MTVWRTFVMLDRGDRRLVLEAAALLVCVRAGLWIVSVPTLERILRRYTETRRAFTDGAATPRVPSIGRLTWAFAAASRRFPASMTCLVKALAADALLRRHAYAPRICFGVRERGRSSGPLEAHAWVECEGVIVVGKLDDLGDYSRLSSPECP